MLLSRSDRDCVRFDLAEEAGVLNKIKALREGALLNVTERRPVLHVALRSSPDQQYLVDGKDVVRPLSRDIATELAITAGS